MKKTSADSLSTLKELKKQVYVFKVVKAPNKATKSTNSEELWEKAQRIRKNVNESRALQSKAIRRDFEQSSVS